ncbi:MAG TPA: TolC family protein, partial [Bacteroidales bacterium]|nr:TolC family protein [Bacteroidales bacterium]
MGYLSAGNSKIQLLAGLLSLWFGLSQAQTPEQKYISLSEAINLTITNNPHAKNAHLNVERIEAGKNSALEFHPTEFTFYSGQLNGSMKDTYYEVNQNFGSPLAHYYKGKVNKESLNQAKTQYEISINDLTAQVKCAWFEWVYAQNKMALTEEELKIYEESA